MKLVDGIETACSCNGIFSMFVFAEFFSNRYYTYV